MSKLSDLLSPDLTATPEDLPTLMVGTVVDADPLRVLVPSIDGGRHALNAFSSLELAEDDEVRVMLDENGGVVVVAS